MDNICITVDVEEWFNILDVPGEVPPERWDTLESRLEKNMRCLLELFARNNSKVTMFWLGHFAERFPELVRECRKLGHEIASHGYEHVLAYKVGREKFRRDIRRGKTVLEDIAGCRVRGFRAAGFSLTGDTAWAFDEIREAGYLYDSSVFPASRGHGGMRVDSRAPYWLSTPSGKLLEAVQSTVEVSGTRWSVFGGGYLRLAPLKLILWGAHRLKREGIPFVLYVHPREIDPGHPRLEMGCWRKFKSYVNLQSTYPKLDYLTRHYRSRLMEELLESTPAEPGEK